MEILVTGSNGFIGRNLLWHLRQNGYTNIMEYDIDTDPRLLDTYAERCDFVFHLAGVNRPRDTGEFMSGNADFTQRLLEELEKNGGKASVLAASSVQAAAYNPYGQSKKAMEDLVFSYGKKTDTPVFVYRLPNVFGKWCRPGYNSAVATFCHNIARGIPIQINDSETVLKLVYIDDLTEQFIRTAQGDTPCTGEFYDLEPVYSIKLGRVAKLLKGFHDKRESLRIPELSDAFTKKLYSTYLSYLPSGEFDYPLKIHTDTRGTFTEFLRMADGQVSVNISKPGVTKGNHWHHSKNEKFLVVSGRGIIRFRPVGGERVTEYSVDEDHLRVVDIPPGYAHSIENTGSTNMVTVMWANECFDPKNPDTYTMTV
ncbi:MAG TPA: capsular biosynthesis protein [Ruminococcaceae bacterium]|nr:capsular biosynthesis protein [Oscillospiraceae bacterium]